MRIKKSILPRYQLDGTPYETGDEEVLHLSHGGGGGGGGTNTQTTVQQADPWSGVQPYLRDLYRNAQTNYNQAENREYPDINPIADPSEQTTTAMWNIQQGNPDHTAAVESAASGAVGNLIDASRTTTYDPFNPVVGSTADFNQSVIDNAGTADANAQATLNSGNNNVGGSNYAAGVAQNTDASGAINQMLAGVDDPRLQAYVESTNQQIADTLIQNNLLPQQVAMMSAGSYGGSGTVNARRAMGEDIADAMGRNSNDLALRQQQIQAQAAQMANNADVNAANIDNSRTALGIQGAQFLDAASNYDVQNALNAGNQALGAAQFGDDYALDTATRTSMALPTLESIPYMDDQRLANVGSYWDAREQAGIDAQIARELYNDSSQDRALQNYAAALSGTSGLIGGAGSSSGTSTVPENGMSPVAGAAGGAMIGWQMGGPYGAAAGAVLGYLMT